MREILSCLGGSAFTCREKGDSPSGHVPAPPDYPGPHAPWAYAASHAGKSVIWHALDGLTFAMLTLVAGLSPRQAVLYFSVWFTAGALAGIVIGRTEDTAVRRVPLVLRAILVVFLFEAFFQAVGHARAYVLFMAGLGLHLAYTWLDIPANSLIARLGKDASIQQRLSWWRAVGGLCASICVTGIIASIPLTGAASMACAVDGWPVWVLGALALSGMTGYCALHVPSREPVSPFLRRARPPARLSWAPLFLLFFLAIVDQVVAQGALRRVFVAGDSNGYIMRFSGEICGVLTASMFRKNGMRHRAALLMAPTAILGLAFIGHVLWPMRTSLSLFLVGFGHGINGVVLWVCVAFWSPRGRESEMSGVATFLFKLALAVSNVPALLE